MRLLALAARWLHFPNQTLGLQMSVRLSAFGASRGGRNPT